MIDWIEFLNSYRAFAQHIVSILLAAAIWRWGGGPERWLIGIFIATMVMPIYIAWGLGFESFEIGPFAFAVVALDLAAAGLFTAVALHANRNYPLWIAGVQLVAVGAHLVRSLVDSVSPLAFAILVIGPSYFQVLLLLIGFLRHVMRQRRYGAYREWRVAPPGLKWVRL